MCAGHMLRHEIFQSLPEQVGPVPITKYMSFDTYPYRVDKKDLLRDFQYSIILENARHDNYFTEKILDCLACKTIPIYWGAPNIQKFFNPEGILVFNNQKELDGILCSLRLDFYDSKREIVEANYREALKYENLGARLHAAIEGAITNAA
jgi:spore maturation protein CgeB